jgi:hypothetical protein
LIISCNSAFGLMISPKPVPKGVLHRVRKLVRLSVFDILSFPLGHPVAVSSSSSSFRHFYLSLYMFLSVTCFRVSSCTACDQSSYPSFVLYLEYSSPPRLFVILDFLHDRSNWSSPAPHLRTFQVFLNYVSECPGFSTIQGYAPNIVLISSFNLNPMCWWKVFLLYWI